MLGEPHLLKICKSGKRAVLIARNNDLSAYSVLVNESDLMFLGIYGLSLE